MGMTRAVQQMMMVPVYIMPSYVSMDEEVKNRAMRIVEPALNV